MNEWERQRESGGRERGREETEGGGEKEKEARETETQGEMGWGFIQTPNPRTGLHVGRPATLATPQCWVPPSPCVLSVLRADLHLPDKETGL